MSFVTRVAVALAAAAPVATVPAAQAAPAWSPPENISASANDIGGGDIAFDARGRALTWWTAYRWEPGTSHGHYVLDGWRTATRAPGTAAFDPPRIAPTFAAAPVLYAQERAVGLDERSLGWQRCGQRTTLRARFGTSDGTFGAPRAITTSTGPGGDGRPTVSANAAGQMLAAWGAVTRSDCSRSAIVVSARRPGGAFGTPTTLRGTGRNEQPSVSVGQGGDAVVAWQRRLGSGATAVEARFRAAGHGWGAVQRLGTSSVAAPLTTAVAQNGRAYVAWGSQSISDGRLDARFAVAVKPATVPAFRAAQTLETIRLQLTSFPQRLGPSLALTGIGAVVAWTGHDSAWRVRVSRAGSSGTFGAPQTVSPAGTDTVLGDLSGRLDGTASVVWSDLDAEGLIRDVVSAQAGPGGPFGAPELVSDGALRQPAVAQSPQTGQPTTTWAQRLGTATSVSKITAYVRASTRSPAGR